MSEPLANRWVLGAGILAVIGVTPALGQEACTPVPGEYVFCMSGTQWADAEREVFGDGLAFGTNGMWLEITALPEEFQGVHSLDALLDLIEEIYAAETEAEGLPAPEFIARDRFQTEYLDVVSITSLVDFGEGYAEEFVTMILEGGTERISISLDSEQELASGALHDTLRTVAELIRPAAEG